MGEKLTQQWHRVTRVELEPQRHRFQAAKSHGGGGGSGRSPFWIIHSSPSIYVRKLLCTQRGGNLAFTWRLDAPAGNNDHPQGGNEGRIVPDSLLAPFLNQWTSVPQVSREQKAASRKGLLLTGRKTSISSHSRVTNSYPGKMEDS